MFGRRRGGSKERSASGAPILRHADRERPFVAPTGGDEALRDAIDAHYLAHLGPSWVVWHELASDLVHLDVYMWRPTPERPMFTFATVGMSDRRMTVPRKALKSGAADLAELVVCLPPDWPIPPEGATQAVPWVDDAYMPIWSLKMLARLPHEYETWLGFGHSIPNGDPPEPLAAGTELCGWVLLPLTTLPTTFHELQSSAGRVEFYGIVALTPDELERKLAQGVESLYDSFDANNVSELLDLGRASALD